MAEEPIPLNQRVACKCGKPRWQRFGNTTLCMRDHCLGGWIWLMSGKMKVARFQVRLIRKRGPDSWLDFIQYFRGECWAKIMRGGPQIGHLDIADATKLYLNRRYKDDAYEPNAEMTMPLDYSDQDEDDLIHSTAADIPDNWSGSPDTHVLTRQTLNALADDVVALCVADQVTVEDAALLMDTSVVVASAYVQRVTDEARILLRA